MNILQEKIEFLQKVSKLITENSQNQLNQTLQNFGKKITKENVLYFKQSIEEENKRYKKEIEKARKNCGDFPELLEPMLESLKNEYEKKLDFYITAMSKKY